MRSCVATVAFAVLVHSVHASAFAGQRAQTASPTADAAVAVAIGLACADRATIEVPVTVEIARPEARPAKRSGPKTPGRGPLSSAPVPDRTAGPAEWVRICGPNGCRWDPRPSGHSGPQTVPTDVPDAAPVPPAVGDEPTECDDVGCGSSAKWRLFGRRR
jgi:hypothetical protein